MATIEIARTRDRSRAEAGRGADAPAAARPDRPDAAASRGSQHRRHRGAGGGQRRRGDVRRLAGRRGAGRRRPRVSAHHAHADHVGRWHGRWCRRSSGARGGCRPPARSRRARVARVCHRAGDGRAIHAGLLLGGPALYSAMGGTGGTLAVAVAYSRIVFLGAIAFWLFNLLAAVVRGTGNMRLPALVVLGGAVITLTVSPALILGWGPFPRLGVPGAAVAMVAYYIVGALDSDDPSRVRPRARPSVARSRAISRAPLLGHPARGRARLAQHDPDEPDDRDPHRARRSLRQPRARRLRRRRAPGVSADSAGLRSRLGAGDHGRHQHRRRTARPRAPHHVVGGRASRPC